MPFALVFVGLVLIVSGVRNTQSQLGQQIVGDFTGTGNFVFWLASLGAVGALGYVPALKKFSIAFMTLILIAMLLAQQKNGKGGFFATFYNALQSGPVAPAATGAVKSSSTTVSDQSGAITTGAQSLSQGVNTIANASSGAPAQNLSKLSTVLGFFGI